MTADQGIEPVQKSERIDSLDVIRGVAVLGILLMNIWSLAWPREVFDYPYILDGMSGSTGAVWAVINVLFEGTQRTLFSILFGAGVLLFVERLQRKGPDHTHCKDLLPPHHPPHFVWFDQCVCLFMAGGYSLRLWVVRPVSLSSATLANPVSHYSWPMPVDHSHRAFCAGLL